MQLGYTIIYVADVEASIAFCERAFGLKRRFIAPGGGFGELDTGTTALAFASHETAHEHVGIEYVASTADARPLGIEVAFVTTDVPAALQRAVDAGATLLRDTSTKPWGQQVAYVRTPDGLLVELCTPLG